jgi:hypothetical protein
MFESLGKGVTLNFMRIKDGIIFHKQLERRPNDQVFFRLKKRPSMVVESLIV